MIHHDRAHPPILIGLAGGSGSGKTTITTAITDRLGIERITVIPHDAYYRDLSHLPLAERRAQNFDHPDSLETELLIQHLRQLKAGRAIPLPVYDFTTYIRDSQTIPIVPHPVILVEGILIYTEPELRQLFDMKLYVDTDADLRFIRRLQRDVQERGRTPESVIQQYLTTVRPSHLDFVEPSKRYADVIIPEGGYNQAAMEMVVARIQTLLAAGR